MKIGTAFKKQKYLFTSDCTKKKTALKRVL